MTEANLLLNQEVEVTSHHSQWLGQRGHVEHIMADGRSLDVKLFNGSNVFLDVTFVREVQDRPRHPKGEPDLGPIANSVAMKEPKE